MAQPTHEITPEKLSHYLALTSKAIGKVKIASIQQIKSVDAAAVGRDFLDMAARYLSDANHFKAKGDFVNAFACVNYAHGFLDAGARIRVFEIDGDELRKSLAKPLNNSIHSAISGGFMSKEDDKINSIRRHIDRIDTVIITALAERMSLIPDIAEYKKKHEIPIFDEKRETEIMKGLKKVAVVQGLDEEFVEEVFLSIINEAKRIQNEIINGPHSAE
ncbi:DUF357 domain-containing protein [Candidatus Woesearchaeota archaeon]|nr:DUF357 domain-containing protein [Candidatus Woesearchaeota archaeon]